MVLKRQTGRADNLTMLIFTLTIVFSVSLITARGTAIQAYSPNSAGYTLVIDAGHGGIDGGAIAADGSKESDINLSIALKLRAMAEFFALDNTMTRQDDSTKSTTPEYSEHSDLVCRTDIINSSDNPVLISIHQNSYPTGQPSGVQVIYSAGHGSEAFGKLTHTNLISAIDPQNRRVAEPANEKLYILSHVSCPAILVECGFMSNFSDIVRLNDSSYQTSLSAVLMASYLQYISEVTQT